MFLSRMSSQSLLQGRLTKSLRKLCWNGARQRGLNVERASKRVPVNSRKKLHYSQSHLWDDANNSLQSNSLDRVQSQRFGRDTSLTSWIFTLHLRTQIERTSSSSHWSNRGKKNRPRLCKLCKSSIAVRKKKMEKIYMIDLWIWVVCASVYRRLWRSRRWRRLWLLDCASALLRQRGWEKQLRLDSSIWTLQKWKQR